MSFRLMGVPSAFKDLFFELQTVLIWNTLKACWVSTECIFTGGRQQCLQVYCALVLLNREVTAIKKFHWSS